MELNWSSVSYADFQAIDLFSIKTAWLCFSMVFLSFVQKRNQSYMLPRLESCWKEIAERYDKIEEMKAQGKNIASWEKWTDVSLSKFQSSKKNMATQVAIGHMFPLSLCTTLPKNIVPMLPLHDVIVIGSLLVTLKIPLECLFSYLLCIWPQHNSRQLPMCSFPTRCSGSTKAWRIQKRSRGGTEGGEWDTNHMGVSKNMGKPPNHPFVHRVFHYFHHPFWDTPIFWKHPYEHPWEHVYML